MDQNWFSIGMSIFDESLGSRPYSIMAAAFDSQSFVPGLRPLSRAMVIHYW